MRTTPRLPWFRVALGLATLAYGVVSMACGSSNEQTQAPAEPVERPSYGAYDPNAAPEGSAEGVPAGDGTTVVAGAAVTPAAPAVNTVRFAVDEAGLEMAVPMARHVQAMGEQLVTTSAVASGDWLLENFVYRGSQLDTVGPDEDERLSDAVVLAMRHRHYDAELLVWTEAHSPLEAERYLDVVVDDAVARLVSAPDLVSAIDGGVDAERLSTHLHGLAFNESRLGERAALQVDLLRTHPVSRVRQRVRLLTVRQDTPSGPVLVHLALAARRDDFAVLAPELGTVASQMTLLGAAQPLALNPQRQLGPVTDQYGLALEPLEVDDLASPAATAVAASAAERSVATVTATARALVLAARPPAAEAAPGGPEAAAADIGEPAETDEPAGTVAPASESVAPVGESDADTAADEAASGGGTRTRPPRGL